MVSTNSCLSKDFMQQMTVKLIFLVYFQEFDKACIATGNLNVEKYYTALGMKICITFCE